MKKLLINDCDFPIYRFFEALPASAQYLSSYAKNMTGYVKSLCEIREENPDKKILISVDQEKMENFYFSSENGITLCKYDKVFYEDNIKTTRIIKAVSSRGYEAIIKDKKENKVFRLKTYDNMFEIFFYENKLLKENFLLNLNSSEKVIYKIDIKDPEKILKKRSNVLSFDDKKSIIKSIESLYEESDSFKVILDEKLTNVMSMKLAKNKIVHMDLNSEIIDKLPYKLLRELELLKDSTIKKASDFIKEQKELDFLTDDKIITPNDLIEVVKEVKSIIKANKKKFYRYEHNKFYLIDKIAEEILGEKFSLNTKEEKEYNKLESKGVILYEFEGFDYENTTYEKFNLENIYSIYNLMKNDLEKII